MAKIIPSYEEATSAIDLINQKLKLNINREMLCSFLKSNETLYYEMIQYSLEDKEVQSKIIKAAKVFFN